MDSRTTFHSHIPDTTCMARRTRYLITKPDGSYSSGLAYSADYFQNLYPDATVEPFSTARKRRAAARAWEVDPVALQEAQEFFGLTLDVEVIVDNSRTATAGGSYTLTPTGGQACISGGRYRNLTTATGWKHIIHISPWITSADASRALWHELTHARQAERLLARYAFSAGETATAIVRRWHSLAATGNYLTRAVEVEARAHEVYSEALPLVQE